MIRETTVGIIGTGLIGGSIGLRARALGRYVIGHDANSGAGLEALNHGCVDEVASRDEVYARSSIVVLAMHIDGTLEELSTQRSGETSPSLILDISSVKVPIVCAAAHLKNFVATHPMAGAESSGPASARADLFEGKPWLYVPTNVPGLDERAVQFVTALGGQAAAVSAEEHDARVALTSHLPQVVATLFGRRVAESATLQSVAPFCGPVARELLRLSRSNPQMWGDILSANGSNVAKELRVLASELQRTADSLDCR
jgi:prephenate dehydrogenase